MEKFMPARKRSAEERKNRNNDWAKMVDEVGVRDRLQNEYPAVVLALDHMVKVLKEYDGDGWTVFSDWYLDAMKKCRGRWPSDLPSPGSDFVWEAVFPILSVRA